MSAPIVDCDARMRTRDMGETFLMEVLCQTYSLEVWGGATFDAALFLTEDPLEPSSAVA